MPMTYSQYIQQNPEEMQAVAGQMAQPQGAPPAPPMTAAQPAQAPQPAAAQAPNAQVAPVQPGQTGGGAQAGAAPVVTGGGGQDNDGNAGMKDQSTIQDIMSIFKMFGGGA